MSLPWLAGDEKMMIWITSWLKLPFREIPPSKNFALINVSNDLALIDKVDSYGFPIGNQAITDREKLARFFEILNRNDVETRFIICDINFLGKTSFDSLLGQQLSKRNDIILSSHLNEDNTPQEIIFTNVQTGLSDYLTGSIFDEVYKYQLYFDSLKLTPLIVHENICNDKADKAGPFVRFGKWTTLNHFILEFNILQKDISDQEKGFNPINLGELLYLPEEDVVDFVNNKIVVVGDFFDRDMHETIFEITSGPVILLNALVNLQNQHVYVDILFWGYLFIGYFFLSWMVFYPQDVIEKIISQYLHSYPFLRQLIGFMSYLILLCTLSTITFFWFGIHINAFFLALYLYLLDKIVDYLLTLNFLIK